MLYTGRVMPNLTELRRKARTITVQWPVSESQNVAIQVTYDPGKITMASQDIPDDGKTLHDYWEERVMDYVSAWDLMDDDGKQLPVSPEGIAKLETALVQTILLAIQEDARPNLRTTTST